MAEKEKDFNLSFWKTTYWSKRWKGKYEHAYPEGKVKKAVRLLKEYFCYNIKSIPPIKCVKGDLCSACKFINKTFGKKLT